MDRWTWSGWGVVAGVMVAAWFLPSAWSCLGAGCMAVGFRLWGVWPRIMELALGMALGLLSVASLPEGPWVRGPAVVVGTVVAKPGGRLVDVEVSRVTPLGGISRSTRGRLRIQTRTVPSIGSVVVAMGEGLPIAASGPPGGPDPVWNARRARLRTQLRAWDLRVVGATPGPRREVHGLLDALATGNRSGVPPEALDRLRRTGTAHLLAISGFHVGLVAALVAGAFRWGVGMMGLVRLVGVPRGILGVSAAVTALVFAASVGAPVSAQRAAGGVVLVALGRSFGRRIHAPSLVGLVATGVLIVDPAALGSPSFQLSFCAVIGLLGWGKALDGFVPPDVAWPWRWAGGATAATMAATLGTLPAAAWWFQAVAPLGPPANLMAMPWTAFLLVPAAMLAAYGPSPLSDLANVLGGVAADGLVTALGLFDVEPWRPAVGALGALALLVSLGMYRRKLWAVAWVWLICARPCSVPHPLRVTWPDVGQGSCALVSWSDGRHWLVDGGTKWARVAPWLRRRRVHHLDVVVVSHADADHADGLLEVVQTMSVGELWVSSTEGLHDLIDAALERGVPVVNSPYDRLHPSVGASRPGNDGSTVMRLGEERAVMLPGDVGRKVEARLLSELQSVDVLALGHHGSASSSSGPWLDGLAPRLAIAQVGLGNFYGHPHDAVRARLFARGIPLLRTDIHGTIEVTLGDTITVRTHRMGVGWRSVSLPRVDREQPALARAQPP